MYICVPHVCLVGGGQEKAIRCPGMDLSRECWKQILVFEEQRMLLINELLRQGTPQVLGEKMEGQKGKEHAAPIQ